MEEHYSIAKIKKYRNHKYRYNVLFDKIQILVSVKRPSYQQKSSSSLSDTAVYFVPYYLGLYSVKGISTENSVQRLRNKKLNKTKWSGLACKKFEFYFQQWRLGTCRALCCDNCCVSCVHYGAYRKSRSKDLSGLASTSVHQLLASSCLVQPSQMSGAPSTSSLEALKGQCVQ